MHTLIACLPADATVAAEFVPVAAEFAAAALHTLPAMILFSHRSSSHKSNPIDTFCGGLMSTVFGAGSRELNFGVQISSKFWF
jgi:hypothetical protein